MDGQFFSTIFLVVLMFGLLYLFLYRPEKKRRQQHQEMVGALSRGDKVITMGGICGVIKKVDNDRISVEVADGVVLKMVKDSIADRDSAANREQTAPEEQEE